MTDTDLKPLDLSRPATTTATAARQLAVDACPPFLLNHSERTFAWACLLADFDSMSFDRELLYVGAVLHDLGLTPAYDGPRCFEREGALAAGRFAASHGWAADRCEHLAESIRLHMQPRVIPEDGAEGYLLSEATSCDVRGHRLSEIDPNTARRVLERFPRLGFGEAFIKLLEDQARTKPGCLADLYLERGIAERIRSAPFDT